jgi:hypothetical protein
MAKETYVFKDSARGLSKVNVDEVVSSFEALRRKHGTIKPEHVVEAAIDESHPLHSYFEWDNDAAAHKYRLQQAAYVIRHVEVQWSEPKGPRQVEATVRRGPAFVNPMRDGTGYEPLRQVLNDKEKRALLLNRALEDLVSVQDRYEQLAELAGVRIAIGEFAKKVSDYERKNLSRKAA